MAKTWPIFLISFLVGIYSYPQKIFFEQLTTAEGLPSDYVNCVFEDSKGYLWIGTDKGACRYDGSKFQYFSNDNGLPSNFVSCFAEDPAGNIWMGTVNGGACVFDGRNIKLFPIPGNPNAGITGIYFNTDSSFFITSAKFGLSYFKNADSPSEFFRGYSFIKKLDDDFFFTGTTGQLYLLQKKKKKLVFHPYGPPAPNLDFFAWLSDSGIIALKGNEVFNYMIENNDWVIKNEFRLHKNVALPSWPDIKKVLVNKNELFIGTPGGLLYIDSTNKQYHFTAENGLGSNYIRSVDKTRNGNIYISTYGAGIKIWPTGYIIEYKMNGKVTSFYTSKDETYITTTKSVYRFNLLTKTLNEVQIPMAKSYTSIYKINDADMVLGTLDNFYKIPAKKIHQLTSVNILQYTYSANSGTSGFVWHKNHTYISTYGDGIFVFNEDTRKIDTINEVTTPPAPTIIESLVSLGNSFAALTYNSGLMIHTPEKDHIILTKQQGLLSNTVYSIFKESENNIWIGTKNGLSLFNGKKIIKTYSFNEGLIGTNVLSVFKDKIGRLWVLADKLLHVVEGEKLRAIRSHKLLYDEKHTINRAAYCKENNILYIGLTDAMLTVDMNKVSLDTFVSSPTLSAIVKDSVYLLLSSNKSLSIANPASKIYFKFGNLSHHLNHQFDLYYKLEGFDDDWKLLTNANGAFYQKLSSGKYELFAKTVNPDGFYSPEFNLISFDVLPPLWKRNWVIILMSIVVLAIFFSIGNLLNKKKYKQKLRRLEEEYRLQLERERIARELHDNVGSQLTYLINKIDDDYPKLAEKKEAEKLSGVARGAMQELRETIWALDKKEVQWDDLHNKIRQLIRLYKTEKHNAELDWQMNIAGSLKPLEALNIYRIIQEALNNAEKYSGASLVSVVVSQLNGGICVEINDNGKGFDIQKTEKGYGLKNMQRRAEEMNALIQFESQPGSGTHIKLSL